MAGIVASIVGGYLMDKIFSEGGEVKGKKGKAQLIVAHGGEVVLNKAQQNKILKAKTASGAKTALKQVKNKKKAKATKAKVKRVIQQAIGHKKKGKKNK